MDRATEKFVRALNGELGDRITGDMEALNHAIATTVFQPRPVFTRGQLVAVADEPFEVVMVKGESVFVKDENGKVRDVAPWQVETI